MSQAGNVQVAWQRRRRRLGDSVLGCLLAIALVLGGTIWGYFKFIHWQPLVKAGTNFKTFKHAENMPAMLEYGRRWRSGFANSVKTMTTFNYNLIQKYKKGKYKNDKDGFYQECTDFKNQLLESIQQFDGQQVPEVLASTHAKLARAHGLCYESVLFLEEAYAAEGAEQEQKLKESEKKMKEAWALVAQGSKDFTRVWSTSL